MSDSAGARWAVRLLVGAGLLLGIHTLVVALVLPPRDAASLRPWPLSLSFSFPGSSGTGAAADDADTAAIDGFHNFGAPPDPETPPPGSPWYAPRASVLNNLTAALSPSATGVYGFLFNGSATPDSAYGTYNWCNMPHVRAAEYPMPPEHDEDDDASAHRALVYVEVVHRHHKRTPYAANGFPHEPYHWDCEDARIHLFGAPRGRQRPGVAHYVPTLDANGNPFLATALGWHGSCQFPQLTAGGLEDAWQHGADLYGVYHGLLRILPPMDDAAAWREHVAFRVTNNPITSQTVTMVLGGMAAAANLDEHAVPDVPLSVEAAGYDSLEPQYACPAAARLFAAITAPGDKDSSSGGGGGGGGGGAAGGGTSPAWADHLDRLAPLLADLDAASGVDPAQPRGFHASVDHYYDNLSARQCHGQPPVAGVAQAMADAVFRVGQWEYSRMYRDDARSLAASVGAWGVWVAQLARHLRTARDEADGIRYRHNVAHDGSISRLLSILQADEMVWPGMGSEVVVELWKTAAKNATRARDDAAEAPPSSATYDVRVLFGGRVLRSSIPELGLLDMVPLDALLAYIDGLVGIDASLLPAKCNGSLPL